MTEVFEWVFQMLQMSASGQLVLKKINLFTKLPTKKTACLERVIKRTSEKTRTEEKGNLTGGSSIVQKQNNCVFFVLFFSFAIQKCNLNVNCPKLQHGQSLKLAWC